MQCITSGQALSRMYHITWSDIGNRVHVADQSTPNIQTCTIASEDIFGLITYHRRESVGCTTMNYLYYEQVLDRLAT